MSPCTRPIYHGQGRWRCPGVGLPCSRPGLGTAHVPTGSCIFWQRLSCSHHSPQLPPGQNKSEAKTSETIA